MDGIIESVQVPPNFDPSRQWFNLTVPDFEGGWGIMSFNMKVLDENRLINARAAISNGAGLGASIMFLVVLLLLTKSEKRKSFVFFLNAACLFTNTIRCLMACSRATGNFVEPYTALVMDPGRVTRADYAVLITGNVFGLIVAAFVYVSLSLQVWIVCITTPPLRRSILMGATITVACVAFALKLAIIYWNIKLLLTYESADDIATLNTVGLVMQTISIWFFSCVFTYKLGYAIIQRRRLNMPQFGPMQIVFIMGCQTMFIPAIFTSFQFVSTFPDIAAHVLTIVCIFLPFSAMWAGVAHDEAVASRGQQLIKSNAHGKSAASTMTNSSTVCGNSCQMSSWSDTKSKDTSSCAVSPTSHGSNNSVEENCIRVDRKFGFSHGDAADRV